jgi:hypothetical protein
MSKKRSPLRQRPLRNPGQSIDEYMHDVLYDRALLPMIIALIVVVLAGLEWWRWLAASPPQPWILSVTAALSVAFAARRLLIVRRELRSLALGRDGEKSVAQQLEHQRRDGWQLLHDLPGSGFNGDHVLITTRGIFAIETKTYSKPLDHDAKVMYDGERVLVDGLEPDRDPLKQARASRDWIRTLLEETTGIKFPVRAVVLFPGWFVETRGPRGTVDVWVLNPKALSVFVEKEGEVITPEDVALVRSRLADHVSRWSSDG